MSDSLEFYRSARRLPAQIEYKFGNGTAVVVPEGTLVNEAFAITIGDIIDAVIKVLKRVFGGGNGCITIITEDGTKVIVCPQR